MYSNQKPVETAFMLVIRGARYIAYAVAYTEREILRGEI